MAFHIHAWLENGNPSLQVIDAHSKTVCMTWQYEGRRLTNESDRKEIQRLFRELILLTCKQEISNCRVFKLEPNALV